MEGMGGWISVGAAPHHELGAAAAGGDARPRLTARWLAIYIRKWTLVFGQDLMFVKGGAARSWKQERREGREEQRTQTSLQSLYAWTRWIEKQSQMIFQSLVQGKEGRARARGDVQYAPHWQTRSSLSSVEGLPFPSLIDNGSERTLFLSYRFCSKQSIDWSAANLHGLEEGMERGFVRPLDGGGKRPGRTYSLYFDAMSFFCSTQTIKASEKTLC